MQGGTVLTSSVGWPLVLPQDASPLGRLEMWPLVAGFLRAVPAMSTGSLLRFLGAGAVEDELADNACASAAARALVRIGALYTGG